MCFVLVILTTFVTAPRVKKVSSFQAQIRGSEGNSSFFCLPSILSRESTSVEQYSILGILFLRFVFSFASIVYRANFPLTMASKFGTSVIQIGYLNSAQGLAATIAGFAVGPVTARFYHGNTERMVKSFGLVKTVSL